MSEELSLFDDDDKGGQSPRGRKARRGAAEAGSRDAGQAAADARDAPLAHRMRPASLDEFLGQRKLLAPGKPLHAETWVHLLEERGFRGVERTDATATRYVVTGVRER